VVAVFLVSACVVGGATSTSISVTTEPVAVTTNATIASVVTTVSTSPEVPVVTSPTSLPLGDRLNSGTHSLARRGCCSDFHRIIFTLPEGWNTSNDLIHKHLGEPNEMAFSVWVVRDVYADPCRWQESALGQLDDIHPEVHEVEGTRFTRSEGGLANQAHRGDLPREMTVVTLGGQAAARIDLSVPVDLDIATCDDGEFRSWMDVTDRPNSHHASGQLDSVYMVDVDRAPAVLDVSHMPATSEEELRELDSILASMVVDRAP
jgi:hypothetical protein